MKKEICFIFFVFSFVCVNAQTEKKKDTVKTEIVNVISIYAPTIADASKVKKNPKIKLIERSKKKEMEYTIFSAPVASTFIPKSGVVKGINIGIKERLYNNYLALGFGNFTSPFAELFLHKNTRFKQQYGLYTKYNASLENSIDDTFLDSNFSNFESSLYYGQKVRMLDWKVTFNTERNTYNWYGLPNFITDTSLQNSINEEQRYNLFELIGDVSFEKSVIDKSKFTVNFFSDALESKELFANLSTDFDIPLSYIDANANDIKLETTIEFLKGEFNQDYQGFDNESYSIFTASLQPSYQFLFQDFSVKAGLKLFASLDFKNDANNFLIYPDITVSTPILKDYISVYSGITGGLNTNTYKNFTDLNPFVSPTLFITQTSEKYNYFLGFNGKFNNNINFNIKGSHQEEEDKPLFIRNNSKSNGTNTVDSNSVPLKGFEYGNSFSVYYDDVKTTSIFAEVEYSISEKIGIGVTGLFNDFTTTNTAEAWNLPNLKATVFGKYNQEKWYAETALFYVGTRKEISYSGIYPSTFSNAQTVNRYVDVNLNGGYHFNDRFSAFLKLNNILNSNYQRFENFTVQGFQVLGGITYKFDF